MSYTVKYHKRALKNLQRLDKSQASLILAWIEKNLVSTNNPRQFGKALQGKLAEYWRYRIGNYRIIANINDLNIQILIVDAGHRKDIYR